jgi:hypothetical protein
MGIIRVRRGWTVYASLRQTILTLCVAGQLREVEVVGRTPDVDVIAVGRVWWIISEAKSECGESA